jgi:hypothetical protein
MWDSLDGTTQYPSRFSFPFPREAKHTEALREAIERSGNRELALDLVGPPPKKVSPARNSLRRARRLVDKICQHVARLASQIRPKSIHRTQQNHD